MSYVCQDWLLMVLICFQWMTSVGLLAGSAGALLFALDRSVEASGSDAHAAAQNWSHNGLISSFDHARYGRLHCAIMQLLGASKAATARFPNNLLKNPLSSSSAVFVVATRCISKCVRRAIR